MTNAEPSSTPPAPAPTPAPSTPEGPTAAGEKPRKSWGPRLFLALFAVGSMATVFGVAIASKRNWAEFVTTVERDLARYPIVEERLGTITEIQVATDRGSETNVGNQVTLQLRGQLDVGYVVVTVVELPEGGFQVDLGGELRLSGKSVVPLIPRDESSADPSGG